METRCSVCGCITDTAELSPLHFVNKEFPVCPFCTKKIKAIEKFPKENAALARDLLSADTKGKRGAECAAEMYGYFCSLGINIAGAVPSKPQEREDTLSREVAALRQTVDSLQKDLKKFKTRYYFSKILGIVMPVIITFIMLIILLKSGALNSIFEYYGMLSDYASM